MDSPPRLTSQQRQKLAERYATDNRHVISLLILSVFSVVVIVAGLYYATRLPQPGRFAGDPPVRLLPAPAPKPRLPVPAFEEDPSPLLAIADAQIGQMQTIHAAARDYLLHKARATDQGAAPADVDRSSGILPATLMAEAALHRGEAFFFRGHFDTYWRVPLPEGNRTGLSEAYLGHMLIAGKESVFFLVEDDPAPLDLMRESWIDVCGLFLQNYYDPDLRTAGPLLVARRVQPSPVPPFVENEEILEVVSEDVGPGSQYTVTRTNPYAYAYLLHKAWWTPQDRIVAAAADSVKLNHLFERPELFRGQVIHVHGSIVRPILRVKLDSENPTHISHAWQGQIAVRHGGQDVIVTIVFIERPEWVDKVTVDFHGYFMQKWGYPKADDASQIVVTPLLIGRQVTYPRLSAEIRETLPHE